MLIKIYSPVVTLVAGGGSSCLDWDGLSPHSMCLFLLLSPLQADVRAEMDSVNTVKFNLTADAIEAIFRTYPSCAQRMKVLNLFAVYHTIQ